MMNLGIDEPGAFKRLMETLDIIAECHGRASELPTDPAMLGNPGTDLRRWITEELPEPTVDARITLLSALDNSLQCLAQIRRFALNPEPSTTPAVLAALMRGSLLSGARPIFMLGSLDPEKQKKNILRIMRQEGDSLFRHYDASAKYIHLGGLIPPEEVLSAQRARHARIRELTDALGEARMLRETAEILATRLTRQYQAEVQVDEGGDQQLIAEGVMWIFNAYSGKAHGYGWPYLVPHAYDLPGDFVADLTMLANLTHMAVHVTEEAHLGRMIDTTNPSESAPA